MTFSIAARSADGESLGVAVASKFLAVGAVVPAAESGVGALATQANGNPAYRSQGLALMRSGSDPATTVDRLLAYDSARSTRQLGVVTAAGPGVSFTGTDCRPWAGGVAGDGYAIQGNILTGPQVVDAMQQAWLAGDPGTSLARRLLDALAAADRAGGDRRGRQSAALLVVRPGGSYGGTSDVEVDLRVDNDPQPVAALEQLLSLHELHFTRSDPATLLELTGDLAAEVSKRLNRLGYDGELDSALASWAGIENLEQRVVPGHIDPVVLDVLRAT